MLELLFLALFVTVTTLAGGCAARVDDSGANPGAEADIAGDADVAGASDALRCSAGPFGGCIDACAPVAPICPTGRQLVVDADGIEDLCRCSSPFGGCFNTWVEPTCPVSHPDRVVDYGADSCESVSPACGAVSSSSPSDS